MTRIILDCDPGHDDAIALMLALASPEVELLGVTTVFGNHSLRHTTENAIRVLDHLGRHDIPVSAGAPRPLVRERHQEAHVQARAVSTGPICHRRRARRSAITRSTGSRAQPPPIRNL